MLRFLYSRIPRVKRVTPMNTTTPTASLSRSSSLPPNIPTTHQSLNNSMAIPAPVVPPHRKRKLHMTYEILDRSTTERRKEPKFIFTASYESSDDASKTDHKDDFCRKCRTTYYKRYAIPVPINGEKKVAKSADHSQRLKYIEAHGEVRRVCTNCRNYFMTLMDDMKQAVGKNGNKDFKAGL